MISDVQKKTPSKQSSTYSIEGLLLAIKPKKEESTPKGHSLFLYNGLTYRSYAMCLGQEP